jgi:hypothetical protein
MKNQRFRTLRTAPLCLAAGEEEVMQRKLGEIHCHRRPTPSWVEDQFLPG